MSGRKIKRREIMEDEDLSETVQDMRHQVAEDLVTRYIPPKTYADQWDTEGLYAAAIEHMGLDVPVIAWAKEEGVDDEAIIERLCDESDKMMAQKAVQFGPENMRNIEKQILLNTIDAKWREHLLTLEHLRSVVGFRSYAQRDPLNEYKSESFQLFDSLLNSLREEVTQKLAQIRPLSQEEQDEMMQQMLADQAAMQEPAPAVNADFDENDPASWGNPGRNEICPCGSGKKFKHCHGRLV